MTFEKEVRNMKKYINSILLAILFLFTACSPQLKESDFILTSEDLSWRNQSAYGKYIDLFDSYFTMDDYGDCYIEDGVPVYCLNEDSKQKENIDRFFELANAELEKKGWDKLETVMVKHSLQELKDAQNSIDDGFERGEFKYFSVDIDVKKNRLEVEYSDISESYQEKVLKCVPEDIEVVFIYAEGGLQF